MTFTAAEIREALELWDGKSPRPTHGLNFQSRFELFERAARAYADLLEAVERGDTLDREAE